MFGDEGMEKQRRNLKGWMVAAVLSGLALAALIYWFQQETMTVDGYTVIYYKNRCQMEQETPAANLEYLKTLPCLVRINWRERIASDLEQEYCYLPGRGVEKTRVIHTGGAR